MKNLDVGLSQASVFLLACFFICYYILLKKHGHRAPPGPRPIPILGNLFDLPPPGTVEYRHWLTHKDKYGPISSVTLMGKMLVILHDKEAARDLLERKAVETSDRPAWEFGSRLCGYGNLLSSSQYNDYFRRGRKFYHHQLGQRAQNHEVIEVEVRRFIRRVLNEPENLHQHIKLQTGSIILRMTYGYAIERNKSDPLVSLVEQMMANMSVANVPLTWAVDTVQCLNYLPESFPGMSFKQTARQWRKRVEAVAEVPYSFVRRQMDAKMHRPSFVSQLVDKLGHDSKLSAEDEYAIKWSAATIYAAGSDSTVLAIRSAILALIMFPEVQRKAHEEIDRVIGSHRLPSFQDRATLPYIEGMVKEAIRWIPITPMGFAHATTKDINYNDYLIPSGTYLLPAMWWFLHDPQVYKDPGSFNPERYLEPYREPDPSTVAFGYGRRVCPGRFFADQSVFLFIAQTLAAFTVSKAVDEQGVEMEVKLEITPGVASHLTDFPYKIEPRSVEWADLVKGLSIEQDWEKSDAGSLEGALSGLLKP
ncbi:hypothetical protein XA68_17216 [Ophiocordyceps unilateralis]|uniref:O-methylsterigmatocystin oxidoreductase n=1 Tax=Ophiocordyceps unilateralis TaxID=268505 RepID=A0A2A9PKD1_OPHUN|nr:hypothetical protein XA68_17216 [Ophiocordyceps unilateralis]